ncbi:LCP family protein [Arthrobacter cavernae]|uniref:LCP family protein n=1 Tax=Arthrobacter cavernae TaxID=2817681 RepID=A0A939HFY3_9MICC|nr:LCP family protein [Arthrobacter cavernae]MBO1267700.1 LCP family protein [Arthrobacter cavernae]
MTLPFDTDEPTAESGLRRRKSSRKRRRNVLIGVVAFVVVTALVGGGYLFHLAQTFNTGTTKIESAFPEEALRPQKTGTAAMNILVMGSDSRGATEVDAVNGAATDQRADTLMLMHIPADRRHVYTISVMRDLWVEIPGHGEAKINAALAQGGVPLMVQTIESVFQQRIDHVAMVDFEGFKGLTDALGGVDVTVKEPFTSSGRNGHYFAAGRNTLGGEQALAFVRERYAFTDGDYQRVRNQQAYLKAVIGKTISAETLTNPVTISNLVGSVSPFISVDKGLDAATLAGLGLGLRDIGQKDVVLFTLPTLGTGTSTDGQSIVLADPVAIADIAAALAADKLGDYVASNSLESGN